MHEKKVLVHLDDHQVDIICHNVHVRTYNNNVQQPPIEFRYTLSFGVDGLILS